ncbi:MAG: hypothetical protein RLZZ142_1505 [Verrucomicrobiota bacterium]
MLYFDHNAKAPLSPRARAVWLDAQERYPANAASLHRLGQRADRALEEARETLAGLLGARAAGLVFTSGATEAANTVLAHLAQSARTAGEAHPGIWVSAIEHPCVLEAAERWFPGRVRRLGVDARGVLELGELSAGAAGGERPAGVVVMAANNETGVLQPWRAVLAWARDRGVPLVCDATQWVGRLPAEGLGECDFVLGSGHKCGGPVGTGFLHCGTGGLRPLLVGGAQEEGRRAGTQNVAGSLALVAALEECGGRLGEVEARLGRRERFEAGLRADLGARILGEGAERLWNTVLLLPPELGDCRQRWVVRLDAAGVAASSGSACASGREEVSHVLEAMGVSRGEAGRALRLSVGWEGPDWEEAGGRLREILRKWGGRG